MSKHSLRIGGGKWAVKEDKLLAYAEGDISGKFRAHELDFDRGDDIYATRVNKEGLIEKHRENRLVQSNSFDNASWNKVSSSDGDGTTVTSGQQGYDGTNDAWLVSKTKQEFGGVNQTVGGNTDNLQTFSVYAKAGSVNHVRLYAIGYAYFDLSGDGSVGAKSGEKEASITKIGNDGWFRLSLTVDADVNVVKINPAIADGDLGEDRVDDGDGTGSVYVQDAQLELGAITTSYLESGASTAKEGVSEDMPRIDYMNGKAQLLIEADRTNYFTCSEYASGNTLSNNPVLTDNYAISPEGRKNAFKIADNVAGTYRRVEASQTKLADEDLNWTFSVFVKKATSPVSSYGGMALTFGGGTVNRAYVAFDEYYGTLVHVSGGADPTNDNRLTLHKAKSYGDYWRFAISVRDTDQAQSPASNNNTSVNAILYARLSDNGTGLGTTENKEYVAYGMQFEKGLFPTSYIPTYGASATRSRDRISAITDSSTDGITGNYNTTMFFDGVAYRNQGNGRFIAIRNTAGDSSDPRILLFSAGHSNNKFGVYAQYLPDNDLDADILINTPAERKVAVGEEFKALLRVNGTSFTLFCNGFKEGTSTFTQQNDIESIEFTNGLADNGHSVNDAQIFPFSVTDNDAFVLTSNETYATFADMSETLKYSS